MLEISCVYLAATRIGQDAFSMPLVQFEVTLVDGSVLKVHDASTLNPIVLKLTFIAVSISHY